MLDNPTEGEYFFKDQEISKFNEQKKAFLRKSNIGFVFQSFNLIDELTVFENVELPLIYLGISAKDRKQKVDEVLEQMNMLHRKKHYPVQLSGGQQQRVAISRAIVANPSMILADEPTGNLDSANGEDVMNLLCELNKKGTTIIMVTHSQRDAEYGRRIIQLLDGHLLTENVKG